MVGKSVARIQISGCLVLIAVLGSGCQTSIGNYFSNRARDFGECFRLQAGAGLGIGATANAAGVAHLGLATASVPRSLGIGWDYGDGYAFGWGGKATGWDAEVDYSILFALGFIVYPEEGLHAEGHLGRIFPPFHWRISRAPQSTLSRAYLEHGCWLFVPAAFSAVADPIRAGDEGANAAFESGGLPFRSEEGKPRYLWGGPANPVNRRARVHAFDIEASVYAGIVYARVGFSPGELVDFLLGWFGADIAGDDRRLEDVEHPLEDLPFWDERGR